jgi:hypothetical protein
MKCCDTKKDGCRQGRDCPHRAAGSGSEISVWQLNVLVIVVTLILLAIFNFG